MKDTFTFENMGKASNEYLREALKNPKEISRRTKE